MKIGMSADQYMTSLVQRLIDAMLDSDMFSPAERDQLMDYRTWDCPASIRGELLYICMEHRVSLPKDLWDELYADADEYADEETLGYLNEIKGFSTPATA